MATELVRMQTLERRDAAEGPAIRQAISQVLSDGHYIGGQHVETFERNFANYLGAKHVIGVGNGLDALRLALLALDVKPGDEVIVPGYSFVATWLAVQQCGAKIVAVDIDPKTGLPSDEQILSRITDRTRVVVFVHIFGQFTDIKPLHETLKTAGIALIEDAAQAHGAHIGELFAGHASDVGCFSFYPTKNLGAIGDAGAVVTDDQVIASQVASLRSYGTGETKYEHELPGWNSRLDPIQAAALDHYLRRLNLWNATRSLIAQTYLQAIETHSTIVPVRIPNSSSSAHANHLFVLSVPDRHHFRGYLFERGIQTDVHYPYCIETCSAISGSLIRVDSGFGELRGSRKLSTTAVSIPLHPWLTDTEIERVSDALSSYRASCVVER